MSSWSEVYLNSCVISLFWSGGVARRDVRWDVRSVTGVLCNCEPQWSLVPVLQKLSKTLIQNLNLKLTTLRTVEIASCCSLYFILLWHLASFFNCIRYSTFKKCSGLVMNVVIVEMLTRKKKMLWMLWWPFQSMSGLAGVWVDIHPVTSQLFSIHSLCYSLLTTFHPIFLITTLVLPFSVYAVLAYSFKP